MTHVQDHDEAQIETALRIAGAEDYSDRGESGVITVTGLFASTIMREHMPDTESRTQRGLNDQAVRISRGSQLEVWCNGYYIEGRGVRDLIHRSVRNIRRSSDATIKNS
jgi:hypothetical protein